MVVVLELLRRKRDSSVLPIGVDDVAPDLRALWEHLLDPLPRTGLPGDVHHGQHALGRVLARKRHDDPLADVLVDSTLHNLTGLELLRLLNRTLLLDPIPMREEWLRPERAPLLRPGAGLLLAVHALLRAGRALHLDLVAKLQPGAVASLLRGGAPTQQAGVQHLNPATRILGLNHAALPEDLPPPLALLHHRPLQHLVAKPEVSLPDGDGGRIPGLLDGPPLALVGVVLLLPDAPHAANHLRGPAQQCQRQDRRDRGRAAGEGAAWRGRGSADWHRPHGHEALLAELVFLAAGNGWQREG
mmetsp:Transcript_107508/g.286054  ORF Transcript_107508/g.286054 Transcript_107508/m.286054 type:complete len:301 (-) Transcript_107508:168-1070(-)